MRHEAGAAAHLVISYLGSRIVHFVRVRSCDFVDRT